MEYRQSGNLQTGELKLTPRQSDTYRRGLERSKTAFDFERPPLALGYKVGMAGAAGVLIWVIVMAISPTTLTNTSALPKDASTATESFAPEDFEIARPEAVVGLASDEEALVIGADGMPQAATPLEAEAGTDASATDQAVVTDTPAAANEAGTSLVPGATAPGAGASVDSSSPSTAAPAPTTSTVPATTAAPATAAPTTEPPAAAASLDYQSNLAMLQQASVRNTNHDGSPYLNTPSDQLVLSNHYGPRSEYLNNPGQNPEQAFPVPAGGQFRAACEFSHFAYDDPLVYPGKPGASHLHMFFGNTHVNAFSTYDTLINSGSSTCNGQELNRTGYWVPALFDGNGNVRIPERVVVYYKGEGQARGNSIPYPAGAAMITTKNYNTAPANEGGGTGKYTFVCSDNFSSPSAQGGQTMPACDGNHYKNLYGVDSNPHMVLEMNIKFPQCWNGKDPGNPDNFSAPPSFWYGSQCSGEFNQTLPNLEYFVNYKVDLGENTSDWYLSSDVDATTFGAAKATGGSTIHGDWWGGWNAEVNQMWIDNCVNYADGAPSGCGFGYLTNGGGNNAAPADGPALKVRPQYTGPNKVSAQTLFEELCPTNNRSYSKPEDAAYCAPGTGL